MYKFIGYYIFLLVEWQYASCWPKLLSSRSCINLSNSQSMIIFGPFSQSYLNNACFSFLDKCPFFSSSLSSSFCMWLNRVRCAWQVRVPDPAYAFFLSFFYYLIISFFFSHSSCFFYFFIYLFDIPFAVAMILSPVMFSPPSILYIYYYFWRWKGVLGFWGFGV